jgi:pyruvate dehydrogenase E2 component (dihydrolipoamide acetyltransferase)
MAHIVIMPKLGQTVEESTIVKWHKKEGDQVKKGEIIFEIETDKAVLEIESFYDGTLLKIVVKEGETVPVNSPVAIIGQPGEELPKIEAAKPVSEEKPVELPQQKPAQIKQAAAKLETTSKIESTVSAPASTAFKRQIASPRARRLAKECGISVNNIKGTASNGRITEADVKKYLEEKGYYNLRITPAAKALAIKEGIDILALPPDALAKGKVDVGLIEEAIYEKPQEMSKIRQIIAQRLTHSFTTIPHFFVTVAVDVSDLMELRKELKKQNKSYSLTDFIIKAVALALKEFPVVNSFTTDGKKITRRARINVGMAVDIKEGLVVPVIKNTDLLTMPELHETIQQLAVKARDGKLLPAEMTGGTFTVSNMGMLNVNSFTAIINPGESAILAVSSITPTPSVLKDKIAVRSVMNITLSSDHRIIDGAMAARFANKIKNTLEDIELWKTMT